MRKLYTTPNLKEPPVAPSADALFARVGCRELVGVNQFSFESLCTAIYDGSILRYRSVGPGAYLKLKSAAESHAILRSAEAIIACARFQQGIRWFLEAAESSGVALRYDRCKPCVIEMFGNGRVFDVIVVGQGRFIGATERFGKNVRIRSLDELAGLLGMASRRWNP